MRQIKHKLPRSTRRAQISLAEADHYSHILQCNNVEPWLWKAKPKGFGSLPAPWSGYATTITVFFCSFTHLRIPDHHQHLLNSSLCYPGPLHKISSQSIYNFLSNVVHRQTDRQRDRQKHSESADLLRRGRSLLPYCPLWKCWTLVVKDWTPQSCCFFAHLLIGGLAGLSVAKWG